MLNNRLPVSSSSSVLQHAEADIGVVVAYGRILTRTALETTPAGFVNVHFSLLPRWRGAAPVERAILAGDETTGVSLMQIDEGLDTGPVIAAVETPIASDETGGSLSGRLSYLGAMLIDDVVPDLLAGRLDAAPQLRIGVTAAGLLTPAEAQIESDVEGRLRRTGRAGLQSATGCLVRHGGEAGSGCMRRRSPTSR